MRSKAAGTVIRAVLWISTLLHGAGMESVASNTAREHHASWRTAVYAGRYSTTRFLEIVRGGVRLEDSHMAAVVVERTLFAWGRLVSWDGEIQAAGHQGRQHHAELNAALLLRGRFLHGPERPRATLALGIGPSLASSVPRIEEQKRGRGARRLVFMPFEVTVAPGQGPWEFFARIHHRSGAFDVISRGNSSNFVALGVRYGPR